MPYLVLIFVIRLELHARALNNISELKLNQYNIKYCIKPYSHLCNESNERNGKKEEKVKGKHIKRSTKRKLFLLFAHLFLIQAL